MYKFAIILIFLSILFILCDSHPSGTFLHEIKSLSVPQSAEIDLISRINEKNKAVQTISSNDIQIQFGYIPLKSNMVYEKDHKFRMIVQSMLGNEMDIGSNSDSFWFWSKRMKPPGLYYAAYTDLYNCRLKDAFHPLWLIESLGFEKINLSANIKNNQKYLVITEKRRSTSNSIVTKITLVDKKLEIIVGHYLLNDNGLIISAEVKEFSKIDGHLVPSKIFTIWHQENVSLTWILNEIRINNKIDPYNWRMPYYKKMINMGLD